MELKNKRKGIGGHQSANMRTDEWLTPPEILAPLGEFDLDPCSPVKRPFETAKIHYTIDDNGLIKNWFGRVWLNPPYGRNIADWIKKMAEHGEGIALIFARTETSFFQRYVFEAADSILFLNGRLYFLNAAGIRAKANAGAPSVLVAYGKRNVDAIEESKLDGKHLRLNYAPLIVVGISPTWFSVVEIAVKHFGDEELAPVYEMVERMAPDKILNNQHWKAKVRQQIQVYRKKKTTA